MKNRIIGCALLVILSTLTGCSKTFLPRETNTQVSTFETYQAAQQAYKTVIPGKTTLTELKRLKLTPDTGTNVSDINYIDIRNMFDPQSTGRYLPKAVRLCLHLYERCFGYVLHAGENHSKRTGNVLLDIFNFHRTTYLNSWRFNAFFIIKNKRVVYKLFSGSPNIQSVNEKTNPLGPIQNLSLPSPSLPMPY